jgi:tetratricopeptide (TPR) repeat protein
MFLSYRDPLFGIIVFFILLFTISALTYLFGLYKEKKARKEYRKLLKRFQLGKLKEDDYIHLYKTYNLPFDSIILLASTFLKKGEYNKAISVYLALLNVVESKVQKEELLELLGTTYYKGGFLQRSKDIFLNILKHSPRNTSALYNLLLIHENLKDYSGASDVIDVLDELQKISEDEKNYIKTLKIINDPLNTFEYISDQLIQIIKTNNSTQRLIASYLIKYNKQLFWSNILYFDLSKIKDLLWYFEFNDINFDVVENNTFLEELYTAKGYIQIAKQSDIFELDILIKLNQVSKNSAGLTFTFNCNNCKKTHPVYESRCPNCHSILSFNCNTKIAKPIARTLSSYM